MGGPAPILSHDDIRQEIAVLAKELVRRVNHLSSGMPEIHQGKKYKCAIVNFAQNVNQLEANCDGRIKKIAGHITQISDGDWHRNPAIIDLWHRLALTVANLSEHPTKKVGALIISKQGSLQAYSANRIPSGIRKKAAHYVRGTRKDFIVCAERLAIAKLLGVTPGDIGSVPPHERARSMTRMLIERGKYSKKMRSSYLLATVTPCHECGPSIVAQRPRGVFYDPHAGHKFTRGESFQVTQSYFHASGITLHPLAV